MDIECLQLECFVVFDFVSNKLQRLVLIRNIRSVVSCLEICFFEKFAVVLELLLILGGQPYACHS